MKTVCRIIISAIFSLISSMAYSVTYNFTTDPYTTFVPSSGNAFTPGMQTSGYIVTSAPVPSNLVYEDITYLITSYSFSDGLHAFTESNSAIHPTIVGGFRVSTDSAGNITDAITLIMSTVPTNVVGNPVNYFAFGDGYHAYDKMRCITAVSDGLCDGIEFVIDQSSRVVARNLYVVSDQVSAAANPIPTTPTWSLALLLSLTVLLALSMLRRRVNAD